MDSETLLWATLLWAVVSFLISTLYVYSRRPHKDPTWAELVLGILCLPGALFTVIGIVLLACSRWLWEKLDYPIRRR